MENCVEKDSEPASWIQRESVSWPIKGEVAAYVSAKFHDSSGGFQSKSCLVVDSRKT